MKFTVSNLNNFNTLFVGTPQDEENNNKGGNLFFGDPASFSPKVYDYIIKRFDIKSILDVGSGLGFIPKYLSSTYNIPVLGMEGLEFNVQNAHYPLAYHDLTTGPFNCSNVDLVTCVEVVEHIDPKYIDNLLDTLTKGRIILMTHATPGDMGEFHLNEQPSEYWIKLLQERGYGLLSMDSQIVRNLAAKEDHCPTYFYKSGLVFARLPVSIK